MPNSNSFMKKIGLTGGIGSGKTTVSKIFNILGVPVFNADVEAKKLYNSKEVKEEIVKVFGVDYVDEKHQVNLNKLTQLVFENDSKLQLLNSIIHPKLALKFDSWCQKMEHHKYIIKEAAVMIESGAYKQCDELILVTSPIDLRIKRVMKRNNTSEVDVKKRMTKQLSDEEKLPFINYLLRNDEEKLLTPQIMNLHLKLLQF